MGQTKQCNDASGSRKMKCKHPRELMGPLEPSDLQTVMLFVAFLSFPPSLSIAAHMARHRPKQEQ